MTQEAIKIDRLKEKRGQPSPSPNQRYDVVVISGGVAGLTVPSRNAD